MTQAVTIRNAADVPEADVKALATRILNNKPLFPDDLTAQQAAELAMIALAYGLDPIAGEVTLFESRPLVTLDGRIRVAAENPAFDGIEDTRPATDDERAAFHVTQSEDMWVAKVWKKGVRFPSVGYGRAGGAYERNALVTGSKRTGYNPGRGPELARKRAIVNALRLLFPLPRPTIPGQDEPLGYRVEEADVDVATGEILDQEPQLPPITREQTKAIHAAATRGGYDAAHYRERLRRMFGVDSSQALTSNQAQAAIAAFAQDASEPTAEQRVAARRANPTDAAEDAFYQEADKMFAAHQGEEPRFFKESPAPESPSPTVTEPSDPRWQRWQTLCAEAVAWGVEPTEIHDLHVPIGSAALEESSAMLGGLVGRKKLKAARAQLQERARALEFTTPQLDGLLEHHFGAGVTLATCTIDQAEAAMTMLADDVPAAEPAERLL